jgi:hypothetical protein
LRRCCLEYFCSPEPHPPEFPENLLPQCPYRPAQVGGVGLGDAGGLLVEPLAVLALALAAARQPCCRIDFVYSLIKKHKLKINLKNFSSMYIFNLPVLHFRLMHMSEVVD